MELVDILNSKGIHYKKTNNPSEILIQCTSGEHDDSNPSLSYNLDKNVFNCFSCGFRGGQIKFLQSIGITQKIHIESKQEYKILKLRNKLEKIKNNDNIKLPWNMTSVTWDFNGISKSILKEFEAFKTTEYGLENYVCIPVYQFNRLKFIEARLSASLDLPKYNRKPDNVQVTDVLFPVDKTHKSNRVILVEGIFDVLNLWQHGVRNALCIFGAHNFNNKKVELLEKIGVTKVTLMMDGDEAGKKAASKLTDILERNDIMTNKIILPENKDPGNLTQSELIYYLGED